MRRALLAAAASGWFLAACSSGGQPPATPREDPAASPLPATAPYVQMVGPQNGYLIWPSGDAWLILRSVDGFRSVRNWTPLAVDTDGGLVAVFSSAAAAVAVGTSGRLYRSPVLTARSAGGTWTPAELPGAVWVARDAVAVRPGNGAPDVAVITSAASGTVLLGSGGRWRTLTTAQRLDPRGRLVLDSLAWLDRDHLVAVGHGAGGAPVAELSEDGGRSWAPLAGLPSDGVAALAPCRAGATWVLPVLTAHRQETMLRGDGASRRWVAGARFPAASAMPAVGCSGTQVWTVSAAGHAERVLVSTDAGQSWHRGGRPPEPLTSLAPTNGGGYATTGGSTPNLWRVSADARTFHRIRLPGWVASLGAQMSTS